MNLVHKLSYGFVGLTAAVAFVAVPLALANEGNQGNKNKWENHGNKSFIVQTARPQNVSVYLGQNGKVEVHGAKVVTVSGNTFTATTVWGSTSLSWNVSVGSSTQLTDKDGRMGDWKHKPIDISHIVVGDIVDWNGQLDTNSAVLTVIARVVNDRSAVIVPVPSVKDIFQGTLQASVSSTTTPTTLSLQIGNTLYTVNVPTGTPVLNNAFAPISLATFQPGDTVRVYGSSNAASTVNALIVRDVSR